MPEKASTLLISLTFKEVNLEYIKALPPTFWLNLASAGFILIGILFIPVAFKKIYADITNRNWIKTEALLVHVEVTNHTRYNYRSEHVGQYVSYTCLGTYEYRIETQVYTAQYAEPANDMAHASQLAISHQVGETKTLYYNPKQPDQYLFEFDSLLSGLLWLLPFAAFAGFGCVIRYIA